MTERIFVYIYYAFLDPRFLYNRCMKTKNATLFCHCFLREVGFVFDYQISFSAAIYSSCRN